VASRQSVGRSLKRAQESGIVEIKIHSPLSLSAELESQVEKAFHLRKVIVVQPPADTEESKGALGAAGATFLERRVQNGDILGVSWSSTVLQCAMHLGKVGSRQVTVVQLNGSLDRTAYSTRAEPISSYLASATCRNSRPCSRLAIWIIGCCENCARDRAAQSATFAGDFSTHKAVSFRRN
jgi:DNA-binding transcriptional regulator LsrR (DeoR family)